MLLLRQVPVQTAAEWDRTRPGFVAVDLVTHEGSVAGGEDACTLDVIDVATGWTETRAVRNKSQEQVFAALRGIRSSLPLSECREMTFPGYLCRQVSKAATT